MFKHLGPVLKCQNSLITVSVEVFSCPKEDCPKYGKKISDNLAFCSSCGSAHKNTAFQKTQHKINIWDVSETLQEALYVLHNPLAGPAVDYYAPNQKRNAKRDFQVFHNEASLAVKLNPAEEMEWLKTEFGPEIKALEKIYGPENVVLEWGYVTGDN